MTVGTVPTALTPERARLVFLLLTVTRWAPVGLVAGVFTLLALERGLSVAEIGGYVAFQGAAVVLLELPTSGFADSFGRRPVLLAAGAVNVLCGVAYLFAASFWAFAAAAALMGVFRALDSGPLEAWYVDTVHAARPGADVDADLARQGTVLGVSLATGSLVAGGLIAWHPIAGQSALLLPVQLFIALNVVHLVMLAALLVETPPGRDAAGTPGPTRSRREAWDRAVRSARRTPDLVRSSLRLAATEPVLRGLLVVEVFWVIAMTVFEIFQPLRLAELVGGTQAAGALMGPITAAGWAIFAAGSTLGGWCGGRLGVAWTAILSRVLNGVGAVVMGLVATPVGLVAAYLMTYGLHGSANPVHQALLHRQATAANRATVLSLASMTMFLAGAIAQPVLGVVAQATTTQVAMVAAGTVSVLGFLGYLPALRAERDRAR